MKNQLVYSQNKTFSSQTKIREFKLRLRWDYSAPKFESQDPWADYPIYCIRNTNFSQFEAKAHLFLESELLGSSDMLVNGLWYVAGVTRLKN